MAKKGKTSPSLSIFAAVAANGRGKVAHAEVIDASNDAAAGGDVPGDAFECVDHGA